MIQLFVDVVFTESVPDSQEDETLRRQKTKRSNNETTIMNRMDCAGREGGRGHFNHNHTHTPGVQPRNSPKGVKRWCSEEVALTIHPELQSFQNEAR